MSRSGEIPKPGVFLFGRQFQKYEKKDLAFSKDLMLKASVCCPYSFGEYGRICKNWSCENEHRISKAKNIKKLLVKELKVF